MNLLSLLPVWIENTLSVVTQIGAEINGNKLLNERFQEKKKNLIENVKHYAKFLNKDRSTQKYLSCDSDQTLIHAMISQLDFFAQKV